MYIVYVQYSTVYIGKHNGDMGENKKLYTFFVKEGPLSVPGFTLCTIFGRMPEFEPGLLRRQPDVLPMSYTQVPITVVLEIQKITPVISQIKDRQKSK